MRNILLTTAFLFVLLISFDTNAQSTEMRDAINARFMLVDYFTKHQPDDSYDVFADPDLYEAGWGVAYSRNLNKIVNLHVPIHIRKSRLPQSEKGDFTTSEKLLIGMDIQAHFGDWDGKGWWKPYLLAGIGASLVEDQDGLDTAVPVGMGMNFRLGKNQYWNAYLSVQTEYRIVFDDYRTNLLHSIGLNLPLRTGYTPPPPPKDSDGDGITDNIDRCPNEAGTADLRGCPDGDGDGIANVDDECPEVAGLEAFKGCPDTDGDGIVDASDDCPEVAGVAGFNGCPDSDGDGLKDSDDKCPTQAGPKNNGGCPILDADSDGIVDAEDKCPNEAGPKKNGGCPYSDTDGDGVIDENDKCPTKAGPASNSGCPEIKVEDKETLEFAAQNIYFSTGKSTIKSSSHTILDKVADILQRYPEYSCSIGGHTDSVGNATSNQILSEKRAKACYNYLLAKGVAGTRLSFTGYGETQPIADNKYKDGRDKNRRVEFNVHLK